MWKRFPLPRSSPSATSWSLSFRQQLQESALLLGNLEAAATNRRFMIYVDSVSEVLPSREETLMGPAKKIALDEKGQPTIALRKFMEYNQVQLSDVIEVKTPKGVYMGVVKVTAGRSTEEMLKEICRRSLAELTFPKAMVWNESRVPFIRPIKNILLLYKGKLLEVEFAGVNSSNRVYGHRLLSSETFKVNTFKEYIEGLVRNFVILGETERRQIIAEEIRGSEEELEVQVPVDEGMLDFFIYSNEYPVVFVGQFDPKYLHLPPEVIAAFMTAEKKLLPVYDRGGRLSNYFLGVSNIPDESKHVCHGNERVIQATFEDAQFFWTTDLRENFYDLRQGLKNVLFQKELGSYFDKSERLGALIDFLAGETKNVHLRDKLLKAASFCKNDLLTRMVREFPSMQGIIGGLYLKEAGEDDQVWKAVYGHYLPKGFSQERLEDLGAGLLSLADRIDNIAGFVSKGMKISSSKDPYGIRRDANAMIKILIDFKLNLDLGGLIRQAAKPFAKSEDDAAAAASTLVELFRSRLENNFKEILHFRYDVVNAVLQRDRLDVFEIFRRAEAVSRMVESNSLGLLIGLHKRLRNIIRDAPEFILSEDLLRQKEEKLLFDVFKEAKSGIVEATLRHDYLRAVTAILEMKPAVDSFFDQVLIMAEEEALRQNRIALLQRIDALLAGIADFTLIVESDSGE